MEVDPAPVPQSTPLAITGTESRLGLMAGLTLTAIGAAALGSARRRRDDELTL